MASGAGEALVTLLSAWNEADSDARAAILDEALGAIDALKKTPDGKKVRPDLERIESAFTDRRLWTAEKQSSGYKTGLSIFNEYMTWAVYVAYVEDHFDQQVATAHTETVIQFMQERRGFPLFGAFFRELQSLRRASDEPISSIYPDLLSWAETKRPLEPSDSSE